MTLRAVEAPTDDEPTRLSWGARGAIVVLCLGLLLFLLSPLPGGRRSLDAAILWSYLPIPILVAIALSRTGRLTGAGFGLETLLVGGLKLATSALILIVYWVFVPPEGRSLPTEAEVGSVGAKAAPERVTLPAVDATFEAGRLQPSPIRLRPGQPLRIRSLDGRLHTLHAVDRRGETLFNVPVLASGEPRTVVVRRVPATVRCEVHPEETGAISPVE